MHQSIKVKYLVFVESLICVAGLVLFSVFSHGRVLPFIFSMAGLAASAFIIIRNSGSAQKFRLYFGFGSFSGKLLIYMMVALLFGAFIGIVYRRYMYTSFLPHRLTYVAFLAALIGSLEEIIFRGFIQGYTRQINILFSVIFAVLAHTAYKSTLFISHRWNYDTDIIFLMKWTILGGLIFSIMREYSDNILPPVLGHAVFDIVVYGDYLQSPWWVWS